MSRIVQTTRAAFLLLNINIIATTQIAKTGITIAKKTRMSFITSWLKYKYEQPPQKYVPTQKDKLNNDKTLEIDRIIFLVFFICCSPLRC